MGGLMNPPRAWAAAMLCAGAAMASAPAQAQEVRTRATVSAGASYGTNPFLSQVAEGSAGSGYVELAPVLQMNSETLELALDGTFRYQRYTKRYNDDFMARVGASAKKRASERLVLSAQADALTSRSAVLDLVFAAPPGLPDDGGLPEPPVIDPGETGRDGRVSGFSGSFGGDYALTPVSSLFAEISSDFRYYKKEGRDYRFVALNLGYARTLSETLSVSANVGFSDAVYSGDVPGARIIAPAVGVTWKPGANTELSARIGADFTRKDVVPGLNRSTVTLAASFAFCDRQLGGSLCLSGKRSARPTGLDGVSVVTGASLGYTSELGPYDSLSAAINYSRLDQLRSDLVPDSLGDTDLLGGSVTYRRTIADRTSIFVTPAAAKRWKKTDKRDANLTITVGISVTVGGRS